MRRFSLVVLALGLFAAGPRPSRDGAARQHLVALRTRRSGRAVCRERPTQIADVDAAFARARRDGKRVMIDLAAIGAPIAWILAGLMELPEMRAFLASHYELISVDVGRFDKNLFRSPRGSGITNPARGRARRY